MKGVCHYVKITTQVRTPVYSCPYLGDTINLCIGDYLTFFGMGESVRRECTHINRVYYGILGESYFYNEAEKHFYEINHTVQCTLPILLVLDFKVYLHIAAYGFISRRIYSKYVLSATMCSLISHLLSEGCVCFSNTFHNISIIGHVPGISVLYTARNVTVYKCI